MKAQHLKADQADEAHAIRTYGKRQAQHPELKGMYSEMQDDEQDHHQKLSQALKGLKRAVGK